MHLILGATGGIGAALATNFEADGHQVVRAGRRLDFCFDLLDETSIAALAARIDGELVDLTRPFTGDAALALVTARDEAEDRLQDRRPSGPVPPEEGDHLPLLHAEADAVQDVGLPVERVQVADAEELGAGPRGHGHASTPM